MDTQIRIAAVARTFLGKIAEGEHGDRILGGPYGDMADRTRAADIEGFEPNNVVFDHVRIVYSGGELQM